MVSTYKEVWPDTAVHPGEHIQDFFDEDAVIPVRDIADKSGLSERDVRSVIEGEVSVSPAIADGLSKALRTTATYWLKLQAHHDKVVERLEENKRFDMEPYRDFTAPTCGISPIKDLVDNGDVPWRYNKVEQARYLCDWLGIPNLERYEERILGRFQRSNSISSPKPAPLVVWLRRGELIARQQITNIPEFSESGFLDGISGLRSLTSEPPDVFLRAMREACNGAGVAFVAMPYMPGSGVRGVARWLDDSRPMIQINDQGNAADRVWFTFYLEVAHILYRDQDTLDFEGTNGNGSTGLQSESARRADEFAENALIPDADWQEFTNRVGNGHRGRDWIDSMGEFASSQGIHPGIVVGRLMKEGLAPDGAGWLAYNQVKQPIKMG